MPRVGLELETAAFGQAKTYYVSDVTVSAIVSVYSSRPELLLVSFIADYDLPLTAEG
jgi:hypothetical protein